MKKVLIVIFTDGRLPKKVYKAACAQDYPECSMMISVRRPDPKKDKHTNITDHMNYSRKLASATDADYFLFVESAVVIPPHAVSSFMSQLEQPNFVPGNFAGLEKSYGKIEYVKKHIIGGWYKLKRKPDLWSASRWIADNVLVSLLYVERSVVKVDKIASGCIMLSREVMEKIEWRSGGSIEVNIEEGKPPNHPCQCAMFGIDAQDAGYELYMDGSVICKHLTVPENPLEQFALRLGIC